jgi:hypothetical protein
MKPKSRELAQAEAQRELELFRQPEINEVPVELIRRQPDSGSAFTLACSSSGLADQTIADFCHIDAGTFSKMKKGLATLQADQWERFNYAVNNRIYPEWCAYQIGCTLVQIKTETERLLEAERARRIEAEKENVLMKRLLTGRVTEAT